MRKTAIRVTVIGLASAGVVSVAGVSSASAATAGSMTLSPASSSTTGATINVTTSGACPAQATNMIVRLLGSGLPAAGSNLLGNTSLGLASQNANGGYTIQATKTMMQVLAGAGVTHPTGAYTARWMCVDGAGVTDYADFDATVNMTQTGAASTNPGDAAYTSSAVAAPTTTTEVVPATSSYGTAATFTATVANGWGNAQGIPAGTVQFKDGATVLGSSAVDASGNASFTASSTLAAGAHSITSTFVPTDATAFGGSSSAASTLTVAQASTTVTLAGPAGGSTQQFQQADFTATTTAGVAGSVKFYVDGAATPSATVAVSNGAATYSTSNLAVGSHTIDCTFVPSNANYGSSSATQLAHNVTAFQGVSADQPIVVTVDPGSLTLAIDGSVSAPGQAAQGNVVDLGHAAFQPDGQFLTASGALHDVTISDTRSGNPGWSATGVLKSDFTQQGGTGTFSAGNLGWVPALASDVTPNVSANQQGFVTLGAAVAAGRVASGVAPAGAGLSVKQPFASAPAGHGAGAAIVAGQLNLTIPTDVPAGTYGATLTFTVM